jgi:hypothetical protein
LSLKASRLSQAKPEENPDDWGFASSIFDPVDWFHITSLQTYRFGRGGEA